MKGMKLLNRAVLLMGLTAICLTAGLTSCSNDDDGTDKGTNDDTDLVSKAIEGTDYTLSTTGDKSSDWTIKSDIGLVAFSEWVNEDAAHAPTNATLAPSNTASALRIPTPTSSAKRKAVATSPVVLS